MSAGEDGKVKGRKASNSIIIASVSSTVFVFVVRAAASIPMERTRRAPWLHVRVGADRLGNPHDVRCARPNSTQRPSTYGVHVEILQSAFVLFFPKESKFYSVCFLPQSVEFSGPPCLLRPGPGYTTKFYSASSATMRGF